MRLSEKTIELNICAQISSFLRGTAKPFWFGLTQKQEAVAGFDACTKLKGRLLVFQFKASDNVLKNGDRKFLAPHSQMSALSKVASSATRSVFYVFPLIGNTLDLKNSQNLLNQSWLLDVGQLAHLGRPTKSDGSLRKNGCHNIYVRKGSATIHSDPLETDLISMQEFVDKGFTGLDGFQLHFDSNVEEFWNFCSLLGPGARGMFIYD